MATFAKAVLTQIAIIVFKEVVVSQAPSKYKPYIKRCV